MSKYYKSSLKLQLKKCQEELKRCQEKLEESQEENKELSKQLAKSNQVKNGEEGVQQTSENNTNSRRSRGSGTELDDPMPPLELVSDESSTSPGTPQNTNSRRSRGSDTELDDPMPPLELVSDELSTSPGTPQVNFPGSSYSQIENLADIKIENCSSDIFLETMAAHIKSMIRNVQNETPKLMKMLKLSIGHAAAYKNTDDHPIDFFNTEEIQWKSAMKTSNEELTRPDAVANASEIEEINNLLSKYNQPGNEFQALAERLESDITALGDIINKYPLGDNFFAQIIKKNLLKPTAEVLNAEYRHVFESFTTEYRKMQKKCEQLFEDKQDLMQQFEDTFDETLAEDATTREVELYELLINGVLETNSKIRNLIDGDDIVERTLRPQLDNFLKTAKEDITTERSKYQEWDRNCATDKTLLKNVDVNITEILTTETSRCDAETERYNDEMKNNEALKQQHIDDLINLCEREDKRRARAFTLSVEQEKRVRYLDLFKKSAAFVQECIHERLKLLEKYEEMMKSGILALGSLMKVTKGGIGGLLKHIEKRVAALRTNLKQFEVEYIQHHQQAYLIVSAFIGRHGQRMTEQKTDRERDEGEYRKQIYIRNFQKAKQIKARMDACSVKVEEELARKADRIKYLEKIDHEEAKALYQSHECLYPLSEANLALRKQDSDLKLLELNILAFEYKWKEKVYEHASQFKQLEDGPDVPGRIDQALLKDDRRSITITGVSQSEIEAHIRSQKEGFQYDEEHKHEHTSSP